MKTKTYRLFVSGRVQQVGYRFYVKKIAEKYGITGFTENLINGDVLIVAQGDKHIDQFMEECHQAPKSARIDNVKLLHTEEDPLHGFEIKSRQD
jgi:acylphosphatase